MILDSLLGQTSIALLGGVAAELLHWYALSRKPNGATMYARGALYWATTAGMVLLGAAMPLLYIDGSASALLCFHLGAATPIVLQKLVTNLPSAVSAQGEDASQSLRTFFDW